MTRLTKSQIQIAGNGSKKPKKGVQTVSEYNDTGAEQIGAFLAKVDGILPGSRKLATLNYSGKIYPAKIMTGKNHNVFRTKEYRQEVKELQEAIVIPQDKLDHEWFMEWFEKGLFVVVSHLYLQIPARGGKIGDIDNLNKPVLDAAKSIIYNDDSQVALTIVGLTRNSPTPGVVATFYQVGTR